MYEQCLTRYRVQRVTENISQDQIAEAKRRLAAEGTTDYPTAKPRTRAQILFDDQVAEGRRLAAQEHAFGEVDAYFVDPPADEYDPAVVIEWTNHGLTRDELHDMGVL